MRQLKINGRTISDDTDTYVMAEIGNNHGGDVEVCKQLFKAAKECGADAVKLQKRDNKTLYTEEFYNKPYENENSYGATYGEHREALEFGTNEYLQIKKYAKELDIDFFATAFDYTSANMLRALEIPAYKIASADLTNLPLIERIASFKKPLVISTGGATCEDIDRVYLKLKHLGADFAFLHCVASYPNFPEDMNLRCIEQMRTRYPDIVIGLSDHYNGTVMAEAATVLGARIIEKHFTLNHTWKGTDHALSLEPQGMESMVHNIRRLRVAMGDGEKKILPNEVAPIKKMAKGIYPSRFIKRQKKVSLDDFVIKSPGGGLKPYQLPELVGKKAGRSFTPDELIKEGDFE